jgi:hypothetical protein
LDEGRKQQSPGVKVFEHFSSSLILLKNKLECFVDSETFQPILTIGTNTSFFQEHWWQKQFYIVAQSGQVRKPFSSALIQFKNKIECFVACKTFSPSLTFVSSVPANIRSR